jgi:hypothetical protein
VCSSAHVEGMCTHRGQARTVQDTSQQLPTPPLQNNFTGDPQDSHMDVDPPLRMLPTDLLPTDMPDSARGSAGPSGEVRGLAADTNLLVDGQQPVNPLTNQSVLSGGGKPSKWFGSGLMMTPVDDDPLHLGPIKPECIFPLPSTVEEAIQLAWTASYRYNSLLVCARCAA